MQPFCSIIPPHNQSGIPNKAFYEVARRLGG